MGESTRMKEPTAIGPYPAIEALPPFLKSKAEVIEQDAVGVKTFVTGSEYSDKLWREVDYLTELCTLFPDLSFRRFALVNIEARSIPLDDVAVRIAKWHFAVEHPAVFSIGSADARFVFEDFSGREAA